MSVTLPGSPEPGLEGEDAVYIKFAEGMTPEKTKSLASKLIKAYRQASANSKPVKGEQVT